MGDDEDRIKLMSIFATRMAAVVMMLDIRTLNDILLYKRVNLSESG